MLHVENLESRCLPSVTPSVFFTDTSGQLTELNNQTIIHTGITPNKFVAGREPTFANPEVWYTDSNNRLFLWQGGAVISTGAFATRLAAGQGFIAFTDGNNEVFIYNQATGSFTQTPAFAELLTGGSDILGNVQFLFTDGYNQLWTLTTVGVSKNTGTFAIQIALGLDANGNFQPWLLDGNGQLWNIVNGTPETTGQQATQITANKDGCLFLNSLEVLFIRNDSTLEVVSPLTTKNSAATSGDAMYSTFGNNLWIWTDFYTGSYRWFSIGLTADQISSC